MGGSKETRFTRVKRKRSMTGSARGRTHEKNVRDHIQLSDVVDDCGPMVAPGPCGGKGGREVGTIMENQGGESLF